MITFLAALAAIALMLIPVIIAFARKHRYRWIITILAVIPAYGCTWIAALIWACWPRAKS
jgi:hypothetical protein